MNEGPISRLRALLFSRVDIASLVVFRVAFGGIMLWEVYRYFSMGRIARYWIDPPFHFTYPGFDWVQPWPGIGMYIHMAVLGVLAMMIMLGAFYRVSVALFFLGFAYTFLLEHALYLNHFYFVCLVSFLLIFVPAHRAYSVDAWRQPERRESRVPFWGLWVLRFQLAVVYTYAGIAKLNGDWIRGEPVRTWLANRSESPLVGWMFEGDAAFYAIAWGGLAYDLFIVPLLLWKRTRAVAFLATMSFHLLNAWFFNIGIFPWFSLAMTTLFFDPAWPRRFLGRMRPLFQRGEPGAVAEARVPPTESSRHQRRVFALIAIYATAQLLIPFRHWLYPGDVAWTEEGHEFSWRMKLRGKRGTTQFMLTDPATGENWFEDPRAFLTPWQIRKMNMRPEFIRQFAHHLAAVNARERGRPVEVRAHSWLQLNDRPYAALVDPHTDLAREPYRLGPAPWITPAPPSPAWGATPAREQHSTSDIRHPTSK